MEGAGVAADCVRLRAEPLSKPHAAKNLGRLRLALSRPARVMRKGFAHFEQHPSQRAFAEAVTDLSQVRKKVVTHATGQSLHGA